MEGLELVDKQITLATTASNNDVPRSITKVYQFIKGFLEDYPQYKRPFSHKMNKVLLHHFYSSMANERFVCTSIDHISTCLKIGRRFLEVYDVTWDCILDFDEEGEIIGLFHGERDHMIDCVNRLAGNFALGLIIGTCGASFDSAVDYSSWWMRLCRSLPYIDHEANVRTCCGLGPWGTPDIAGRCIYTRPWDGILSNIHPDFVRNCHCDSVTGRHFAGDINEDTLSVFDIFNNANDRLDIDYSGELCLTLKSCCSWSIENVSNAIRKSMPFFSDRFDRVRGNCLCFKRNIDPGDVFSGWEFIDFEDTGRPLSDALIDKVDTGIKFAFDIYVFCSDSLVKPFITWNKWSVGEFLGLGDLQHMITSLDLFWEVEYDKLGINKINNMPEEDEDHLMKTICNRVWPAGLVRILQDEAFFYLDSLSCELCGKNDSALHFSWVIPVDSITRPMNTWEAFDFTNDWVAGTGMEDYSSRYHDIGDWVLDLTRDTCMRRHLESPDPCCERHHNPVVCFARLDTNLASLCCKDCILARYHCIDPVNTIASRGFKGGYWLTKTFFEECVAQAFGVVKTKRAIKN